MEIQTLEAEIDYPLVVDLDGTLINTDLLQEGIILLLRKNPLYFFYMLIWLLKGKAYLKSRIFQLVDIPCELLPYNTEILDFLHKEIAKGRKIVLATASPIESAWSIAKVHPVFYKIYGTTKDINLKGGRKEQLLSQEFGKKKFDYIGNSYSDVKIFASARYSYLVNPSRSLKRRTSKVSELKQEWYLRKGIFRSYVKAIRAYQWVKNLLIFVPLLTSHAFLSEKPLVLALMAFASFSLVASAGYLINDLLDLNGDRVHPRKKSRPLASGRIPIVNGIGLAVLLLCGGFFLAARLNQFFWLVVLGYFITSLSYSVFLKKIVLYDTFILAVLYSTRVFAGAVATNIILSSWLIAFSTFIFLSLAFVKRYSELAQVTDNENMGKRGRGYVVEDIHLLQTMGVVSGFISVVVFSLYLDSPDVELLYSNPKFLWITSLLFLFWISRIWMLTVRGKMTDDPIVFTLRDWISYLIFAFVAICILLAMYIP
ncbi:MAG: UbiA family prenyltransferase [Chitinophagaceae bacterium]